MLRTGNTGELEDLHLQTVSAKVYSTEIASKGVETCRISCGGHGYNALSGFGRMYAHTVNAVTYEGDNYVISQQVTKSIVKYCRQTSKPLPPSLAYLESFRSGRSMDRHNIDSPADWLLNSSQQWALESRLARLVQQHLEEWGRDQSYSSHALTMAHSDYVYWNGLWKAVHSIESANVEFAAHMRSLAQVVSLLVILQLSYLDLSPRNTPLRFHYVDCWPN